METDRQKLTAIESDTIRRSCKISRIEIIRNQRIKEMIKIEIPILHNLRKIEKFIWHDRVKRVRDEKLHKIPI